jgi:flagellar basal-body rod protein FlgG
LDGQGFLTTASGYYVLDEKNQRIQLNSDQFAVAENGAVLQDNAQVARLGVAYSNNPSGQLVKEGDGLFKANAQLANAYNSNNVGFTLKQGYLEGSNVDEGQTMTEMLATYRSFEANQKVLQAYDRSMDKAVNEIGKLG